MNKEIDLLSVVKMPSGDIDVVVKIHVIREHAHYHADSGTLSYSERTVYVLGSGASYEDHNLELVR